jgi:hypothetical protein
MDTDGMSFEDRMMLLKQRHAEFQAEMKEMIAGSKQDGERIQVLLAVAEAHGRRPREGSHE